MIELIEEKGMQVAKIKVIGVGGAGGNTVNSLIAAGCQGIEFIVANTDAQALEHSKAAKKVQIGIKSTKGLGTGANPELGQRSAEEDLDKILEAVGDADIVFLSGGMGGGTGSGAIPVIARALKEAGILSIAVVTKPFLFEGKRRARLAEQALAQLKVAVDTLIVIPNQNLIELVDNKVSMIDAFSMINEILSQSVTGIADIITKPGHINVDFADVRAIMKDMGLAILGTGRAAGENRAREAALKAISSPLLENMNIDGARGVLLNITGGKSLGLHEISQAASIIYERADEQANIILGSVVDEAMGDEICVTIIATGFVIQEAQEQKVQASVRASDETSKIHAIHEIQAQQIQQAQAEISAADQLVAELKAELQQEQLRSQELQKLQELKEAQELLELQLLIEKEQQEKRELQELLAAQELLMHEQQLAQEKLAQEQQAQEEMREAQAEQEAQQAQEQQAQEELAMQAEQAQIAKSDANTSIDSIDLNDFDVPAYLRQKVQHQNNVNQ